MKKQLQLLALSLVFAACAHQVGDMEHGEKSHAKGHGAHWTYGGETGPMHWGDMSEQFAACKNGMAQSPINITQTTPANLPALETGYQAVGLDLINNGHTLQLNTAGAGSVKIGEDRYELLQFHFHLPSEEQINGENYDLVAHLVHKNQKGELGVVAVLFKEGEENPFLANFWDKLPTEAGGKFADAAVLINPMELLPSDLGYFGYMGSLTTPPCSEGVHWHVLKTPVSISAAQKAAFAKLYHGNNRPVQPLNGREVKASM
ncbi:MAG: carbonic anhydrase family protein [bacterium]|nr:carbonic anhydrase family protein [bacterium]